MEVLIAVAVYSTLENQKDECLYKMLCSLRETVDLNKHKLGLSINSYTGKTLDILKEFDEIITYKIFNDENIGTAEAVNKIWKLRKEGQHCVKLDDDVIWYQKGWVEIMKQAIERDRSIGIIGLKRKDCCEKTNNPDPDYRSELIQLPQTPGERWIVVEKAKHIMGTCCMFNSDLLNKIGYLYQAGAKYGYDDVMASWRSQIAGFKNVFLFQIEIDHIDNGNTPYQGWKERHAGEYTQQVIKEVNEMIAGTKSIYYNPFPVLNEV